MNFLERQTSYTGHLAAHIDGLDSSSMHTCPCSPMTCTAQQKMTPVELAGHLNTIHGIPKLSLACKEAKILSDKSVNAREGLGEGNITKRVKRATEKVSSTDI
jgi:hypothetical protein